MGEAKTASSPAAAGAGPNLVLIGYRATGKTSVGRRLARRLGRDFVDLDELLVREAGKSIPDMVAEAGWEDFRRREKELVARFRGRRGLVLATGGGVVLDPENVQALRENGVIVWLTAEPAAIRARLTRNRPGAESRPSLTGSGTVAEVLEVLRVREPLYRAAAQVVVDTTGRTVDQVAEEILKALRNEEIKSGR